VRPIGRFQLLTPPAAEPVTVDEAMAHCRVEHDAERALFERWIAAGRRFVEGDTGLALISQTWTADFDTWDERALRLRPNPVAAVTGVAVWDGSALASQSLDGFQLVAGRPALLFVADTVTPPVPMRSRAGIRVTFTSGFGDAGSDVPEDIRQAILFLVAHWHENRTPTAVSQNLAVVGDIKFTVEHLIGRYRSPRLA